MARPSHNTDRMLIKAAKQLLPATGVSGLKLRRVADKAGVNLGMFHYHFRSKDEFIKRVLVEIYGDFFSKFKIETSSSGSPLERLGSAVVSLGRFARDNRSLAFVIIRDILGGRRDAARFAGKNFTGHIAVIAGLVEECRKNGSIINIPAPQAIAFIAGSIAFPNAVMEIIDKSGAKKPLGITREELAEQLLSDEAIDSRAELVIRALTPPARATHCRGKEKS